MAERQTFVIVGAGLAGAKAAEALRTEGFEGRLVLIGAENELPYERPPLSKDYLRGESEREKARVHPEGFYSEHDIELMTGTRVESLDVDGSAVVFGDGARIGFDRLLLATGAEPRRLPIDGSDLAGVHYLRTIADADALRLGLGGAERLVVIGGGWIGAEVAASARQLGVEVTIIEPASVLLEAALGQELGSVYTDLHREHGVEVLNGTTPAAFEGAERVERVRTADGRTFGADVVLIGIGALPRVELAEQAGVLVENGVIATKELETNVPGVVAAGGGGSAPHPVYPPRGRGGPRG